MSDNKSNLQEFSQEQRLYTFVPNFAGAMCWLTLEDVPLKKKASIFRFETLGKKERYMTPVQKNGRDYAKIYILDNKKNVTIIYVERSAVYQGVRYYRK